MNRRTIGIVAVSGLAIASCLAMPRAAHAQEQAPDADTAPEIVVIGSNLRSNVAAEEAAVPISIISSEQLRSTGDPNIGAFLLRDPALLGSSGAQDGRAGADDPSGRSTANIRGLGDRYTLTLVNGRRISLNESGNLLLVPTLAVDRIEVLKSGASAVYGSDAVAGAVNVSLKRKMTGIEMNASYGDVTSGRARTIELGAAAGFQAGAVRGFAAASYYDRNPLPRRFRVLTRSNDVSVFENGNQDFNFRSDYTNPGRISGLPDQPDLILDTSRFGPGTFSLDPADYRPFDFARDSYDRESFAISGSERINAYASLEIDVAPDVTLFSDFIGVRTDGLGMNGSSVVPLSVIGGVPAANPYNPFGVDVPEVSLRILEPGPYEYTALTHEGRLTAGVRARVSNFDISLAGSLLRSDVRFGAIGVSQSGLREAINRTGTDAFNAFCNLCNTPQQLRGVLIYDDFDRFRTTGHVFDLTASGSLLTLPAGDLRIAVGAEHRREALRITPGRLAQAGDLFDGIPTLPERLSRTVRAVYAEARVPIWSGGGSSGPLEATFAVRHENYNDIGSTTRPLASLRWEAIERQVVLRANWSTSFRAPYLSELAITQADGSEEILADPAAGGELVNAFVIRGSNPNLKPETARSYSFGTVLSPAFAPRLRLTVDYFNIAQRNIVVSPDPQLVLSGVFPGTVLRDGIAQSYPEDLVVFASLTNAAGRDISGIDAALLYTVPAAGLGSFDFEVGVSRLLKFAVDPGDGTGARDLLGTYSLLATGGDIRAIPKWKGAASVTWTAGAVTSSINANYIGSYDDDASVADDPDNPPRVRSNTTVDAQVQINLSSLAGFNAANARRRIELYFGIDNVFNRLPDYARGATFSNAFTFDENLYSIRGRYAYGGLRVRL